MQRFLGLTTMVYTPYLVFKVWTSEEMCPSRGFKEGQLQPHGCLLGVPPSSLYNVAAEMEAQDRIHTSYRPNVEHTGESHVGWIHMVRDFLLQS